MSKTTTSVSNLGLVKRVMAMLNAGDEGKIHGFLLKVIRDRNKEISARKQNMEAAEFEYKSSLTSFQEQLEDAQQDYSDAFLNIETDNVKNNATQSNYVDTYLDRIADKKRQVKSIETLIKTLKVEHKDALDLVKLEIKELQSQIKEIQKG